MKINQFFGLPKGNNLFYKPRTAFKFNFKQEDENELKLLIIPSRDPKLDFNYWEYIFVKGNIFSGIQCITPISMSPI